MTPDNRGGGGGAVGAPWQPHPTHAFFGAQHGSCWRGITPLPGGLEEQDALDRWHTQQGVDALQPYVRWTNFEDSAIRSYDRLVVENYEDV